MLKDTGSAVVWWLSRNDKEVEGAVDRIGLLAQLSAAANNESVQPVFEYLVSRLPRPTPTPTPTPAIRRRPSGNRHPTPASSNGAGPDTSLDSFLAWFGFSPDDPDLELFAERLIDLARAHGKSDVVDELRRRFGHARPDTDDVGETSTETEE